MGLTLSACGESTALDNISADINLAEMSDTMAYSTLVNMLADPADYLDKSVLISGTIDSFTNPVDGVTYYAVVITDEEACCSLGVSISFEEEYTNLPETGEYVVVTGIFDEVTVEELDVVYNQITNVTLV